MIKENLYNKTVDILVQAYFNDTLEHGNCYACAVGNLVAANMDLNFVPTGYLKGDCLITKKWNKDRPLWDNVFYTGNFGQEIKHYEYINAAKAQIDITGYSVEELAKVEFAFETAKEGNGEDEYMFNGLMAVIESLDIIHENTDTALTTATKQRFVKSPA